MFNTLEQEVQNYPPLFPAVNFKGAYIITQAFQTWHMHAN